PAARLARRHDLRAERPAARLSAPRHGLRAAHALRQALHGLGDERAERAGHDRDGGDGLRQGLARRDAGDDLADQRQLTAPLRRPHARRARRVREARPGDDRHAVPADGRDVAGERAGDSRAAGRGGVRRNRARADDPPGLPRRVRLLPLEHRHAVGLAELRHARVGGRPLLHRADRAPLQPAVPRRRRADVVAGRRRAGGLRVDDVALADVPRRHELRHALGRVARVGARLLLREVRHRRRDAAHAARGVQATGDQRGDACVLRPPGGGAGRALPRRRAHAGALPRVLLPAPRLVDRELRALEPQRRPRRGHARERHLEEDPGGVRAARDGTGPAGGAEGLRRSAAHGARRLMFIAGAWAEALTGEVFDAESPVTGAKIGAIQKGGREDAQRAIAAANEAAPAWARVSPFTRATYLNRIADEVERRRDALVHALTLDQGKPLAESRDEVEELVQYWRNAAEDGKRLEGRLANSVSDTKRVLLVRRPRGVIGVITPWNWPYTMPAELIAPALAAGN